MKCVFVLWRGTADVQITSNKTYSMLSWRDIKDSVDYIHKEYCCKGQGGSVPDKVDQRAIYLFGVSNGAICSTHYLINDAEQSPVRAAAFLGCPLDTQDNEEYFANSAYGFYNKGLGK
jgi:predicted alpha/beta-fold hydrolase